MNFLLMVKTLPKFQGPPLMQALKTQCGEGSVAAWALGDSAFVVCMSADDVQMLEFVVREHSKEVRTIADWALMELGTGWAMRDEASLLGRWLTVHAGSPRP